MLNKFIFKGFFFDPIKAVGQFLIVFLILEIVGVIVIAALIFLVFVGFELGSFLIHLWRLLRG